MSCCALVDIVVAVVAFRFPRNARASLAPAVSEACSASSDSNFELKQKCEFINITVYVQYEVLIRIQVYLIIH